MVSVHLESRVTCSSKEVGAWTDDSAMDLVDIRSAVDREIRVLRGAKYVAQATHEIVLMSG